MSIIKAADTAVDVAKAAKTAENTSTLIDTTKSFKVRGPDNKLYKFPAGTKPAQAKAYIKSKIEVPSTSAPKNTEKGAGPSGFPRITDKGEYRNEDQFGTRLPNPASATDESIAQYVIPPNSHGDRLVRDFFFDARKKQAHGKAEYSAEEVINVFKSAFKDNKTPNSQFYYNLYDRLGTSTAKDGKVLILSDAGFIGKGGQSNWAAAHHWGKKETFFPISTLERHKDDPSYLNTVMGHELTHGGTARILDTNQVVHGELSVPLARMTDYVKANGLDSDPHLWYGLTNTKEFASEIYSSPMFRNVAKEAGVWYQTVTALAGILGLSAVIQDQAARAEFEKIIEFDPSSGSQPMQTTGNYTKLTPGTYLDEDSGRYFEIKKDGSREDLV